MDLDQAAHLVLIQQPSPQFHTEAEFRAELSRRADGYVQAFHEGHSGYRAYTVQDIHNLDSNNLGAIRRILTESLPQAAQVMPDMFTAHGESLDVALTNFHHVIDRELARRGEIQGVTDSLTRFYFAREYGVNPTDVNLGQVGNFDLPINPLQPVSTGRPQPHVVVNGITPNQAASAAAVYNMMLTDDRFMTLPPSVTGAVDATNGHTSSGTFSYAVTDQGAFDFGYTVYADRQLREALGLRDIRMLPEQLANLAAAANYIHRPGLTDTDMRTAIIAGAMAAKADEQQNFQGVEVAPYHFLTPPLAPQLPPGVNGPTHP